MNIIDWIPISEPPKEFGEYLIYMFEMNRVCTAFYEGKDGWRLFDKYYVTSTVTHWAYKPEPPNITNAKSEIKSVESI